MPSNKQITFLNIKDLGGLGVLSILIFIAIVMIGYFGIWGYQTSNIKAISVTVIFGFLLLIGLVLGAIGLFSNTGKYGDSYESNWSAPAFGLVLGFFIQGVIVGFSNINKGFSIFSIEKNSLFSTFQSQMPQISNFMIQSIMVPIVEEIFFIFAIPQIVIGILRLLKIDNKYVTVTSAVLISSLMFALFHVGQQGNIAFFIAAMIFRAVTIILFWGDVIFDVVWFAKVYITTTFGMHIGNNWMTDGFQKGVSILMSNIYGWSLLIVFGIFLIMATDYLHSLYHKFIKSEIGSISLAVLTMIIGAGVLVWL